MTLEDINGKLGEREISDINSSIVELASDLIGPGAEPIELMLEEAVSLCNWDDVIALAILAQRFQQFADNCPEEEES